MSVKVIPGKPAVTETVVKVISPATPTIVQVEMTVTEAYLVTSLLGQCTGVMPCSLYNKLRNALDDKTYRNCSILMEEAVDGNIEIVGIQDKFTQVVNSMEY